MTSSSSEQVGEIEASAEQNKLADLIHHAAHYLPSQGPINVFIHHNTLHAFEDLTFNQAVRKAGKLYNCQPFLPEDRYRQELARGRILPADLEAVLRHELGAEAEQSVVGLATRMDLRLAMLRHPIRGGTDAELHWFVAETDALNRFREDVPADASERFVGETRHWVMRDLRGREGEELSGRDRHIHEAMAGLFAHFGASTIEKWSERTWESFTLRALWRVCRDGVHGVQSFTPRPELPLRHRDLLLQATGQDADRLVNDLLIRYTAAYLDQGFSPWPLPNRDAGFLRAFAGVYGQHGGVSEAWLRGPHGLREELARIEENKMTPLESVRDSLDQLGVKPQEEEEFIKLTLLSLRGWAGMIWQLETRIDRPLKDVPSGTLVEFLAVRLILERLALRFLAREEFGFKEPLSELRGRLRAKIGKPEGVSLEQRAFTVFQVAQVLGWTPQRLHNLNKQEWSALCAEVEAFSSVDRRWVFQQAYERRYWNQSLDALMARDQKLGHKRLDRSSAPPPKFQATFCLDDREECFRRHLEEVEPECETFGVAGFYSVPIYYRGAAEAHFHPLCPVVVRPRHYVAEEVVYSLASADRRRADARRAIGTVSHRMHLGSRTLAGGAVMTACLGVLAAIPMVARILFPRLTQRIRQMFGSVVQPPPLTRLDLERPGGEPGPEEGRRGFTVEEMAGIVERLLFDIGLTAGFSRLILVFGHGSSSVNNPHESAYDCGACGGARGGPNARAFARMANDPRVRQMLAARGLEIPSTTVFVGGFHNTGDDSTPLFDLDRLPSTHVREFTEIRHTLDRVRELTAHERCRRFSSASLSITPEAALRHVEARSADLAQVRPELGHAANALSIVGRRQRTSHLFLDRRAFLTSYDANLDDEQSTILARILAAVIPVCAGISLEYYFSCIDSKGYGCGSKLPHNLTGMLGVMDGAASDLRTGLPWQMVEIHEPMRLLFVIETTPEAMLSIMERNESINQSCRNEWVQIATLSPESDEIHLLVDGKFEPYTAESLELPERNTSMEWYRGWQDPLGFALIGQANPSQAAQERVA